MEEGFFTSAYHFVVDGPWWVGAALICLVTLNHLVVVRFDEGTVERLPPLLVAIVIISLSVAFARPLGLILAGAFAVVGTAASLLTAVIDPFSSPVSQFLRVLFVLGTLSVFLHWGPLLVS